MTGALETRLTQVRTRIAEAALRSGRSPEEVRWVAVTKGHPVARIEELRELGVRDFGENRVEELRSKVIALDDSTLRWHAIGHLQRRAAPGVWGYAHLVHSVDSVRLAERLSGTAPSGESPMSILLQVNTSGEESKGGFEPGELPGEVGRILALPGVEVSGLMTMAPFTEDRDLIRATFARLRRLQEELRAQVEGYGGSELSMGMSNDFEVAIEEGATLLRLGTILLGERGA